MAASSKTSPRRTLQSHGAARLALNCNGGDRQRAAAWLERDLDRQFSAWHEENRKRHARGLDPLGRPVSMGDLDEAIRLLRSRSGIIGHDLVVMEPMQVPLVVL